MPRKPHNLTGRETPHVIAALRLWGRWIETGQTHPAEHPMCADRLVGFAPMTLDEIETLIGKLDGTWTGRGLRTWDPTRYL